MSMGASVAAQAPAQLPKLSRQAAQPAALLLQKPQPTLAGVLRIGAPPDFGRHCIVPLLPDFLAAHPGVEVDLHLGDDCADLAGAPLDIVFLNDCPSDGKFMAHPIAPMRKFVCGAPSYFARYGIPTALADLAKHNCINVRSPFGGRVPGWEFACAGRPVSLSVKGSITVNSTEVAAWAAQKGLGLAQLDSYQCVDLIWDGDLVATLKKYTTTQSSHWLCYRRRQPLIGLVGAFADFACEQVLARWGLGDRPRPAAW
jgi:DNA-binding transcriptional LysR family regulator